MAGRRKKRKRSGETEKLLVDDNVEIRSLEDGLLGSWHPAIIITRESKRCLVKYDHLVRNDQNEPLCEYVGVSSFINGIGPGIESSSNYRGRIRPIPPKVDVCVPLQYSMCVDAYYNDAWWEGVVFDTEETAGEWKIFFPDLGDELSISTHNLRLTQDWNEATGEWSLRDKWLFLEIIEELQRNFVVPVSIKQIWYDLQESEKYPQFMEWTFQDKPVWGELIMEVINDYLRMISVEFLKTINLSLDLVVYNKSKHTSDCTENSGLNSARFDAIVPTGNDNLRDSTGLMATESGTEVLESSDVSHEGRGLMVPVLSDLLTVSEQPSYLSLPPSIQAKDSGSSLNSSKESSSSTKLVSRSPYARRVSKHWQPLGTRLVPKECLSCIAEYLHKSNRHGYELTKKVRQHLLSLGWKIDFYKEEKKLGMRYTSPDGKPYYSLFKVCKYLEESVAGKSSHCLNSSSFKNVKSVESRYCPEAIIEYLQPSDVCLRTNRKKRHPDLVKKARNHLSAIGWTFWSKRKLGKQEWRYYAPEDKTYCSLRKACKAVLARQSVGDIVQSPSQLQRFSIEAGSGGKLLITNSEIQRSTDPLMQQPKECSQQKSRNQVKLKFLKGKGSHLLHNRVCSSQRRSKLNDKKNGFAPRLVNIEKSGLLRKPSVDIMSRKRKLTSPLRKGIGSTGVNQSNRVTRSSKKARHLPSTLPYNPLNVLSWLIDNNVVLPRAKVYYRGKDNQTKAEGWITRDGIKCGCCQNVLTLAGFEAHARNTYQQPAANILLEDGRSLIKCQMQMLHNSMRSFLKDNAARKRRNAPKSANDHICSVCQYGGDLILCDGCPSSFHANCVNLQVIPDGDWFCPSCCCGICGRSQSVDDTGQLNEKNTLFCGQCERQFHVRCLGSGQGVNLDDHPIGKWFCCRSCAEIYWGLQELQRKPIPLGHDNLTWTLIKPMQYESGDSLESYVEIMAENHSKLSLALEVMHECFEPVNEPRTRRDLVEDVIFGRGSELKRLNFTGFYTVLLEKNDELISVATLRIYGGKVAEVPLVGTRFHYRRLGMCRFLINEIEKKLMELGVEKLVLPAVPSVLNTWTRSFGFSEMPLCERSELLAYTFLDFQGTVMCQKLLRKPILLPSGMAIDCQHELCETDDKWESSIELGRKSAISEVYHEAHIEGSDSVDLGPLNQFRGNSPLMQNFIRSVPKDNDNSGCKDPPSDATVLPLSDQRNSEIENNPEYAVNQDRPVVDKNTCKFKGEIKQYTRKKPLGIRSVSGANYPNVEVSCR